MKIIFLDIDGIVNSGRTAKAFGDIPHGFNSKDRTFYDWVAVALLKKLCDNTGSKCVLSSSWRMTHSYNEVGQFFNLPIIGATPQSSNFLKTASGFQLLLSPRRGEEIATWLKENPQVTQYIIIDDNDEVLKEQKPYFVHVSHSEGFILNDYEKAYTLLNNC